MWISFPIFPGVRAGGRIERSNCARLLGMFLIALVLAVAFKYWFITVPIVTGPIVTGPIVTGPIVTGFEVLVASGVRNRQWAAKGLPMGPTIRTMLEERRARKQR